MTRDPSVIWGISLDSLFGEDLYTVPEEFVKDPLETIDLSAKFEPYRDLIEECHAWQPRREGEDIVDDPIRLEQIIGRLPMDPFWSEFTFDEICKVWFSVPTKGELHKLFERNTEYFYEDDTGPSIGNYEMKPPEPLEFIFKLRNSIWHYGRASVNWNTLVIGYYAIPDFEFGPGFEVRFDHTTWLNFWGRAQHILDQIQDKQMPHEEKNQYWLDNRLYLDGIFGYLIYYRGRHVMTIGFSLGTDNIYISQIQLRHPKGNRWLYKIPTGYFNYTVERMQQHFANYGLGTYLVDAKSLADRVASLYAGDLEIDPAAYQRMINIYSQPLDNYARGPTTHRKRMTYHKLLPYPRNLHRNPYSYRRNSYRRNTDADLRELERCALANPDDENTQLQYHHALARTTDHSLTCS